MTKSIEFKEKALRCIESICEDAYMACDGKELISESSRATFDLIYKLAHAAADSDCSHPTWEKELEEIYQTFIKEELL